MRQSQKAYEKLAENMSHGTPEERERVASVTEYERGREDMRCEVVEALKESDELDKYTENGELFLAGYATARSDILIRLTQQL